MCDRDAVHRDAVAGVEMHDKSDYLSHSKLWRSACLRRTVHPMTCATVCSASMN